MSEAKAMKLSDVNIHAWLIENGIKTEQGNPLDFRDHLYMWDVYADFSPKQVMMKAAQVTASTCSILKAFFIAKKEGIDLIYTLPTEADRNTFVGGKVNRLIAQNPILQEMTKDKDSVEQKQIGSNIIHFRGTWSQKTAMMVPSDLNVYDELDTSKQEIIEQYATRLQHSDKKYEWYLSHPSATDFGIHKYWLLSDQKHWFIVCSSCKHEQYLSWPDSIDIEREAYVCKKCKKELSDECRRVGRWVKKYRDREYSGYWIPLLIRSTVSAREIIAYKREKGDEYFYNKVLGLPYVGAGNKLTWPMFAKNLTNAPYATADDEQVVIGLDTGLKLDYVIGDRNGLFYHATASDYDELDRHMERWERAIAVVDAGGDLIGSRKFMERWPGRVFLCHTGGDRKTVEMFRWGTGDEYGNVIADRNRTIQLVVDEFGDGRIPVHGTKDDWHDYWTDWKNLTRTKVIDPVTGEHKGYKWIRSGRDHKCLASAYWRVGMDRYGFGGAEIVGNERGQIAPVSPEVTPDMRTRALTPEGKDVVEATMESLREGVDDWRDS